MVDLRMTALDPHQRKTHRRLLVAAMGLDQLGVLVLSLNANNKPSDHLNLSLNILLDPA